MDQTIPSPRPARFPTFARICRRLFSWSCLRRCLVAFAVLATLIAIYYAEENWRGKRAWNQYEARLRAQGVDLDWKKFVPPRVPDDRNFTMTPFLAPLYDFNPRPLQPGQNFYRDTNGFNRVTKFGEDLGRESGHAGRLLWTDGQPTDLEVAVALLRNPSITHPAVVAFPSRIEAARAVLQELESRKLVLDELRTASHRPSARFNVDYDNEDRLNILLPHLGVLRKINRVVLLRASAELAVGDANAAFDDLELSLYLSEAIKSEPFIISQLVRVVMANEACRILWEGLAAHCWSDSQLQNLRERLQKLDVLQDMHRSFNVERAIFGSTIFDVLRSKPQFLREWFGGSDVDLLLFRLIPTGWLYLEQLSYHQFHDDFLLPGFDARNRRIQPGLIDQNARKLQEYFGTGSFTRILQHRAFPALMLPSLSKAMQRAAAAQTTMDEAAVACALERYRALHGSFPDSLAPLIPQFLDAIPSDVVSGKPLVYRRTHDTSFLLYSVGWNEKDDGGAVVREKSSHAPDLTQGDWVWPAYPPK